VLHTERSATYDAGNRHGLAYTIILPDDPAAVFAHFLAAFPKPRPAAKEPATNGAA
jgi:hypothetical protein